MLTLQLCLLELVQYAFTLHCRWILQSRGHFCVISRSQFFFLFFFFAMEYYADVTCSITMTHNTKGNGLAASLSNTVAMPDSLALVEQAAFRVVSVATDMALGIKLGGRSRGIRGGQGGAGAVIKMDMLQAHFPDQQYDMMNPRTRLAAMSMTWGAVAVSGFGASEPPSLKLLMHNTELNTLSLKLILASTLGYTSKRCLLIYLFFFSLSLSPSIRCLDCMQS